MPRFFPDVGEIGVLSEAIMAKVFDRGLMVQQDIRLISSEFGAPFDCISLNRAVLSTCDCFDHFSESRDQLLVLSRTGDAAPAGDFSASI
jgi:hypothetical protein